LENNFHKKKHQNFKTKYFSVLITLLIPALLFSQKASYYFQQEVNFNINIQLDDENHELTSFEEIEYTNSSSQSLNLNTLNPFIKIREIDL